MKRISFITTVNHNIGDDFVREGLKYLLRQKFGKENLKFESIHKHSPITSRYGFDWFRALRYSRRIDPILPLFLTKDRVLESDFVVQSGAPVYWCHNNNHCFQNEWYKPLIKERFIRNKKAKLLNLAAGTCQKYHSDGSEFCSKCNDYMREFYDIATVTTVRDTLAKIVLSKIGIEVPIIPCSSIFAIDEHNLKNEGEEYVVLNYMKGGAHYTFGQEINFCKWEQEFKDFYFDIKKREKVIFSCHNQKEINEALEIDPKANIFYEKNDFLAYMKFYAKAKFGIMNRVHGSFIMASFGKPSIIIGNDSRAKMGSEIGLKSHFVNDVDYKVLYESYHYLKDEAINYSMTIKAIKENAFNLYQKHLSNI